MPRGARSLALYGENRQPGVRVFRFIHFRICFLERKQAKNFYFAHRALGAELRWNSLTRRPRF